MTAINEYIPERNNKYFRKEEDREYYVLIRHKKDINVYTYNDIIDAFGEKDIKKAIDIKRNKTDGMERIFSIINGDEIHYGHTKYKLYEKFKHEISKKMNGDKSYFDQFGSIEKLKLGLVGFIYGEYNKQDVEYVIKKYIERKTVEYINPEYDKRLKNIAKNICLDYNYNFEWVIKYFDQVIEFIERYENINTQKTYISTIMFVLKHYVKNSEKYYNFCSAKLSKLSEEIEKICDEQKVLDSRYDNILLFDDIVKLREKYEKTSEETEKLNYQYLILCLYTMQPCIRSEYKDMEILRVNNDDIPIDTKNYLNICEDGEMYICMNKDKNIYAKGRELIKIIDTKLSDIINRSLELFDRKYLISKIYDNKTASGTEFRKLIDEIFAPLSFGIDMFRSAYVMNIYNKYNTKKLKEIASAMRTSVEMMTTHYNKFMGGNEGDNLRKQSSDNYKKIITNRDNAENKDDVNDVYAKKYYKNNADKIKEAEKNYYDLNKEVIIAKLREKRSSGISDEQKEKARWQDYLRKLNKGVMKPKEKTLNKYNICLNENTGKYERIV